MSTVHACVSACAHVIIDMHWVCLPVCSGYSTGVLIACYLVYTLRISPSEAVHYVRIKRPRSIQTRAQISQVFDFARLLGTQLVQYPDLSLRHGAPFTLQHYLNRQALLLHGQEARTLRQIPKVGTWPLHYSSVTLLYLTAPQNNRDTFLLSYLLLTLSLGGVPPVYAPLLLSPGSPCTSRGICWAREKVNTKDNEQDTEGNPGVQTVLAFAEGGS